MTDLATMGGVEIDIGFGDDVADLPMYQDEQLHATAYHALAYVAKQLADDGLTLPYFVFDEELGSQDWIALPKTLSLYICGTDEARQLNLDARGKDYATNILSYPSGLPNELLAIMGQIALGELIICHDVVERQAGEQGKSVSEHLTHLVVHGILHLLGFDHELGQKEQDEMEGLEIAILADLGVGNPYEG